MLGYFLAYSPLIVAFAIAFHILLPGSRAFGYSLILAFLDSCLISTLSNLEDGQMKVLTMLLGEFDFLDLMVDDPTTPWMAKILFAAFLVVMSIVLMNLVVGLAISDIAALRCLATG